MAVTWHLRVLDPKKSHLQPLPKPQPTAGTRRQEVSALSRQLVEAQEKERRSIARELHDEIGQALTGLKLMLETRKAENIDEAMALVNDLIARLRNLSMDLRPPMLDDLGLLPALLAHIKRFTETTNIRVRFSHADISCRFDPEVESAAYRIIQEALTNVARHANVDSVGVSASADAEWLYIMVSDHGKGFDANAMSAAFHSSGLTGMIERAKLLGGKLDISSRRGQGTRILAHLPILCDEHEGNENADNRAG
jgi:signal transduction histidine kinase